MSALTNWQERCVSRFFSMLCLPFSDPEAAYKQVIEFGGDSVMPSGAN